MMVLKHGTMLPREAVYSPPLQVSKARLDEAFIKLVWGKRSWYYVVLMVPSNTNQFMSLGHRYSSVKQRAHCRAALLTQLTMYTWNMLMTQKPPKLPHETTVQTYLEHSTSFS